MPIPKFDIFSGKRDRDARFIETVSGLRDAIDRMRAIAYENPGCYFLFSPKTHTVVAIENTSADVATARKSA